MYVNNLLLTSGEIPGSEAFDDSGIFEWGLSFVDVHVVDPQTMLATAVVDDRATEGERAVSVRFDPRLQSNQLGLGIPIPAFGGALKLGVWRIGPLEVIDPNDDLWGQYDAHSLRLVSRRVLLYSIAGCGPLAQLAEQVTLNH